MPDQILELNRLLQSILTDIKNNMPAALSPKVFFPIKEEPISDTEANKENIPPSPIPFNFEQELISLYNKEFTNPMLYHLHNQQNFLDLTDDTNLRMFDSAYCCHHLLSEQEKALNTMKQALTNMQNSLNTMISDAQYFTLPHFVWLDSSVVLANVTSVKSTLKTLQLMMQVGLLERDLANI